MQHREPEDSSRAVLEPGTVSEDWGCLIGGQPDQASLPMDVASLPLPPPPSPPHSQSSAAAPGKGAGKPEPLRNHNLNWLRFHFSHPAELSDDEW